MSSHPFVQAQVIEVFDNQDPPYTLENMITNVFLGDGVEVTDIQFDGAPEAAGYFQKGMNDIGLERGIVLTTGSAKTRNATIGVDNPASAFSNNDNGSTATDPDIEALATLEISNLSKYTISFVPYSDTIRFRYVFASEEYPEFTCSSFNDIFGFFISGPNPSGGNYTSENIALIPGTNLPVAINNVHNGNPSDPSCAPINQQYYNDNSGSPSLIYDAFLDVFVAEAAVVPCQEYTMKIVIADQRDEQYDSAVFLEAKSFGTSTLDVEAVTVSIDGTIVEGCAGAEISFVLPYEATEDVNVVFSVFGTATEGSDYTGIPSDVTIPQGSTSASFPIMAFDDGLAEGIETIGIEIQRQVCDRDTFWLNIRDPLLEPFDLQDTVTLCAGEMTSFDVTMNVTIPEPPVFSNPSTTIIFPDNTLIFSEIEVSGVSPLILTPQTIASVCIDSLEHPWIDDLDIYLVSPSGIFIELTSDNGSDGGNGLQSDYYLHTCFTPTATQDIKFGNPVAAPASAVPFTGNFQPEGYFGDLWEGTHPTNGTWQLLMIDDTPTAIGQLFSWSIEFNSSYTINYQWSPDNGLSCSDCPTPTATPDATTTYLVQVSDSYGCLLEDSVTVVVLEQPLEPVIDCDNTTHGQITFDWQIATLTDTYEVNINNMGWETPNIPPNSHIVNNLNAGDLVTIQVRTSNGCSESIASLECMALNCTAANVSITNQVDASCAGQENGQVSISATGDNPPFTYTLGETTNTTGTFENLAAGTYTLTATDAFDCPTPIDVQIFEPNPVLSEITLLNGISCVGDADAVITVEGSGGTGNTYDYLWDNGTSDSLNTNLGMGWYFVTVTDQNNCTQTDSFQVIEPLPLSIAANITDVACNDDDAGAIDITVNGGTGTYSYTWNTTDTSEDLQNISEGTYILEVSDQNNCMLADTFVLTQATDMNNSFFVQSVDCHNETTGTITTTTGGGVAPYEYTWSNGATTPNLENIGGGLYYLTVTDDNDCEIIDSVLVEQPETFIQGVFEITPISCNNQNNATVTLTASGGTAPYLYSINGNEFAPNNIFDNLPPNDYIFFIEDANGCIASIPNEIQINEPLPIEVELGDNVTLGLGQTYTPFPVVENANGVVSYFWENRDTSTLSCLDCPTPDIYTEESSTYLLTVIDENGCVATDNINIFINRELEILVPTGFTPNGDNLNDLLVVHGKSERVRQINFFRIYDRWGEMVYEKADFAINDLEVGWDGTLNGQEMPSGIYVWYLEAQPLRGKPKIYKGQTTLIR